MNSLAIRDRQYHRSVVKLLEEGDLREAVWQVAYFLPVDNWDRYDLAREYVLWDYADILRYLAADLVQVQCTFCEEVDLRIWPNLEACRICGCAQLRVTGPANIGDMPGPKRHAQSPSAVVYDPCCHQAVLGLLAEKRFRDAVHTVAEHLPVLDWITYQNGRDFLLRHYVNELQRCGENLVWTECASCGERDLRILPGLEACRVCGGEELAVLARARVGEPPRPGQWRRRSLPPKTPAKAQPAFSGFELSSPAAPEMGFDTGWRALCPRSTLVSA